MAGKDVAGKPVEEEVKTTALVETAGVDWQSDAGKGMEGADSETFAIPFIRILQKGSPQCDEDDGAYIEGAKPGMFLDTVSGRLYDGKEKGIDLVPCSFERRILRWGPRGGEGGGLKGIYLPEQVDRMQADGLVKELDGRLYVVANKDEVPDPKRSDRLNDTRSHYCLLMVDGTVSEVLIALASTQIKKSRQLMSMLRQVVVNGLNPPTFANVVHATTVPESNDQGSWHGIRFAQNGFVTDKQVYERAKAFNAALAAGTVRANYEQSAEVGDDSKF
jgi:hypothetical protein